MIARIKNYKQHDYYAALNARPSALYPNINKPLLILATLPFQRPNQNAFSAKRIFSDKCIANIYIYIKCKI